MKHVIEAEPVEINRLVNDMIAEIRRLRVIETAARDIRPWVVREAGKGKKRPAETSRAIVEFLVATLPESDS